MSLPEVNGLKKYLHHSCKMRIVSKYFFRLLPQRLCENAKAKGQISDHTLILTRIALLSV